MNGRCRRAKPKPRYRCAQEGLLPAGPRHEELALRSHAPRKYSTNYHVLFGKSSFFQSLKTRSTERRKRILWKKGEERPRPGTVTSGGLQLPAAGRSAPGDSCQSDQVPEGLLSIVVFTGPRLCLLSPRRRTRSPGTTEGDPPCAWRRPVGTPARPLVQ